MRRSPIAIAMFAIALPALSHAGVTIEATNPLATSPTAASTDFATVDRSGRLQLAVTLDGAGVQINAIVQAITDTEILYGCATPSCFIEAWNIGSPPPVGDVQIQLQTPVREVAIHVFPCSSSTSMFAVVGPAVLAPTSCPIAGGPDQWIHISGVGD